MESSYDQVYEGSLLTQERYSSDRKRLLRNILAKLDVIEKNDRIEDMVNILEEDLPEDIVSYLSLKKKDFKYKREIMACYLLFIQEYEEEQEYYGRPTRRCKRSVLGDQVCFIYRDQAVEISKICVNSFLFHNVVATENYEEVVRDIDSNVLRQVPMYPERGSVVDGQMKIMTDAVLAVDALENKENQKILVIGSSHEPGIHPRSSYMACFYLVTNSQFHMYDPLEESGMEIVNTNQIYRYRQPFVYRQENLEGFDLIIDDAWTNRGTSIETYLPQQSGSQWKSYMPANYSMKVFELVIRGKYYYQVGKTEAREKRLVTRSLLPYYNHSLRDKLGNCSFCIELLYHLIEVDYDESFFHKIRRCHRISCGFKYSKDQDSEKWETTRAMVEYVPCHRVNDEGMSRLIGDSNPILRLYNVIELREEHIKGRVVVVSDPIYNVNLLMSHAAIVYWKRLDGMFKAIYPEYKHWRKLTREDNKIVEDSQVISETSEYSIEDWNRDEDKYEIALNSVLQVEDVDQLKLLGYQKVSSFKLVIKGNLKLDRNYRPATDYMDMSMNKRKYMPRSQMEHIRTRNLEKSWLQSDFDSYDDYRLSRVNIIAARRANKENKIRQKLEKNSIQNENEEID